MRAIIVGAGEVGYQVAKFLSFEAIDVVVIDRDKEKLRQISSELDVAVVEAEGGNLLALQEAEADKADILLAVTNSDETNMLACLLAKAMFTIPRKIARIRNPEYFKNERLLSKENLDINPAINPELEVARAIIRLLEIPFAADVEDFEGGTIKVIGFKVTEDTPLINKSLKWLEDSIGKRILIGIIERGDEVIIPSGNDVIKQGDIIYMPVKKWGIAEILPLLGVSTGPAKKIMIFGGGRVGYNIASIMELKADIKIIERNSKRCKYLCEALRRTLVLCEDGADQKLLLEENIDDMDAFVAVSGNEELNIMTALLAKKLGAKKIITIANRADYMPLARSLGFQAVLSPRMITASTILRYVRKGDILSLTAIAEDKAEIIEARIRKTSPLIGRPLKEAKLPKATIIGTIIRGEKVIIPSGEDVVLPDDKLIVFTIRESITAVEKILI
ncbi:Trk system potassium transporter TrkA [Thermodesulfovibrionales bacterium]|nr:Trk system potassium transporter TrkA [Thermodesulfovibrionales bacterium]MCL0075015.1 Trk system potassium transporter TrkA [Thermodesulfovibrionales bacterium]